MLLQAAAGPPDPGAPGTDRVAPGPPVGSGRGRLGRLGAVGAVTWSDVAGWYDELLTAGSGPHETAVECLLGLLPPLDGLVVLDVACGQGLATRAVAAGGAARVVGTDESDTMVSLARRHGAPPGSVLSYVVDDAQRLGAFASGSFEGVTCQLGLMDIPDLDAALGAMGPGAGPAVTPTAAVSH